MRNYAIQTVLQAAQGEVNQENFAREKVALENGVQEETASRGEPPWDEPRTVVETDDRSFYAHLKNRLAKIPTRSKQSRQALYIDLWTGQHWLGLSITGPTKGELLKPVSTDTAHSIATMAIATMDRHLSNAQSAIV